MTISSTTEARSFVRTNQLKWLECYKNYVSSGRVLVVGHGLGYTTEAVMKCNPNVVGLDLEIDRDALFKERVVIYDGTRIPFDDNEFDAVVVAYVLHHAKDVSYLFKEINRVSRSKIIVIEETYQTFLQKLSLVYYCWYFNRLAGQGVSISWNSYLTSSRVRQLAKKYELTEAYHKEEPMRSYKTELFVFSK